MADAHPDGAAPSGAATGPAGGLDISPTRALQVMFGPLRVSTALTTMTSFACLIAAALDAPVVVTAVLGALAIALGTATLTTLPPGTGRSPLIGQFITSRIALAGAVAAAAVMVDIPWHFWIFLGAAGIATVGEEFARPLSKYAVPYAANFPGVRAHHQPRVPTWPLLALTTAAIVASYLAVAGDTGWVPVQAILAVLAVAWWVAVCVDDLGRVLARQRFIRRLPAALESIAPAFVLHWDAPPGTDYQVGMWLPELERIGQPYFVLVRSPHCFDEVTRLTARPVVMLRYLEDLDDCIVGSLRAAFYVNNGVRNAHMVRYAHLTHIQLNHGESDKAPSFNPVFRMYDLDFVAGQAAIDRFEANGVWMPREMFRIVGRPQVVDIAIAAQPISAVPHPTVLYAPTWQGFTGDASYSSLPWSEPLIQALLDRGCRVIFRPHPYSYQSAKLADRCHRIQHLLGADHERTGRAHLYGEIAEKTMSLVDCFNAADAMVSDVSSVVADFLYSEKPLGMVSVTGTAAEFRDHFPIARAAYVLAGRTGADVSLFVDQLLHDEDLGAERRGMKAHYLGDIPSDGYAQRFVEMARAAIAGEDIGATSADPRTR